MTNSKAASGLLLVNLLATWFMVGLTWVVQLVHYPLFAHVGAGDWDAYHREHMKMITVIVAPVMFIEALSAAALVFAGKRLGGGTKACVWIAAAFVLVNWVVTAGVQVPLHNKLAEGLDVGIVRNLVAGNWLRTAGWSIRGMLMAYIAWQVWATGTTRDPALQAAEASRERR